MTLSSSVDLPEPETPLRQTSRWSGTRKVRPETLCLVTSVKRSQALRRLPPGRPFDPGPTPAPVREADLRRPER